MCAVLTTVARGLLGVFIANNDFVFFVQPMPSLFLISRYESFIEKANPSS